MIKNSIHGKIIIISAAFTAILIYSHADAVAASKDIKKFKVIEFKDFNYLSKNEIVDKAGIKIDSSEIIVDIDLLRKALIEQPLVKTFKIVEKGGRLSVIIRENEPVFLCGLKNGDELSLFETDGNFKIISKGRVHAFNMPLVIINKDDISGNNLSGRIKNFLYLIRGFANGKLSGLLREIDEIDLTDAQSAAIHLKGRRTLFIMMPDKDNFLRLNDSAGYFDRIMYYPRVFKITSALGIIKKG